MSSPASPPVDRGRFPALTYRNFRLYFVGQAISAAGTQMQMVAISWEIYQLTGSALILGLVGLARLVPVILFSLVGGVVADAHSRRIIMLFTQSAMMLVAFLLALFTLSGIQNAGLILALTAMGAAAAAFDSPARQSLVPNLVPREHLTNALSLNNTIMQSASIAGPALGGLVIAGFGVGMAYLLNGLSFLAVLVGLALMDLRERPMPGANQFTFQALTEGFRFVRRNDLIWSSMILDFFATFFASASALLPIFAKDILRVGAEGLGLLYSAESIGALIAGLGVSFLGDLHHKGRLLLSAVGVYGAATIFYGFSTQFLLSAFFLMVVGAADAVSTILRQTIRQVVTPDNIRGRMTAVNMVFFMGGPQLGNFEAGAVAAWLGAPFAVVTGGIGTLAALAAIAWVFPRLRAYDR